MTETNFKHTDLGLIPHDWEVKTLEDYADILNGDRSERYPKDSEISYSGIPFINAGHIVNGQLDFSKMDYISIEKYNSMSGVKLKINDLLVCLRGSLGKNAKIDFEGGTVASSLCVIRPYAINPNYLSSILNSSFFDSFIKEENNGSSQPNLSAQSLLGFKCPLPPTLAEQERIAGALSSIDTLIGALTEQIEKKRHIKQGAMQQLLTGKKRLAGFTGEWKSVKLGELCQLFGRIGFRGYTKNDLVEKGMGAITFSPSDIHDQKIDYSHCDYISFHKYEESPEIKVFNGDIIFGKTASIGKCAIIDKLEEKATINPQFVVLKKFKCNNYFLYYKLVDKPFQTQVLAICGGSTIPTMSQEKLKEQELLFPPTIAEQSAIAAVLSRMDTEIAALEQKRDKYIAIKSGMMQNLLTGKIRLV